MEFTSKYLWANCKISRIKVCDILRFFKTLTERRSLRAIKTIADLAIIFVHAFQGMTQPHQHAFNSLQFILLL